MLRKFNLNTTLIKCKFENHKNIKEHLIKLIDSQKAEKINTMFLGPSYDIKDITKTIKKYINDRL